MGRWCGCTVGKTNPTFMKPITVRVSTLKHFMSSLQAVCGCVKQLSRVLEPGLLPEIAHHIHTNSHISEILKLKAPGSECRWGSTVLHHGHGQQALLLSGLSLLKGLCRFSFMLFSFGFYSSLLPREFLLSLSVSGAPLCCVLPPQAAWDSSQSFPLPCLRSATIQSRCFRNRPLPVLSSSHFHAPRSRLSCHRLHPSACCSPCRL